VLWTHSNLSAARGIYQKAGFQLVATDSHEDFGPRVTAETWELRLSTGIIMGRTAQVSSER
jgi:hypothetical protein